MTAASRATACRCSPVDTELGRKTRIHQSSCNLDFTCLDGDCPSFVTIHERVARAARTNARRAAALVRDVALLGPDDVEEPRIAEVDGCYAIYLTGIGGTGVVTMSQVLATAGMLEGFYVAGLDQTGLSQKGGPVVSHVKLATAPIETSNAVGVGDADALIGFDLLVASDARHLSVLHPGTHTVVSTSRVADRRHGPRRGRRLPRGRRDAPMSSRTGAAGRTLTSTPSSWPTASSPTT